MRLQFARVFLVALLTLSGLAPLSAEIDPFLLQVIQRETDRIEQVSAQDWIELVDAYTTRGESFLLVNEDPSALQDFLSAYHYSLLAEEKEQPMLSLRSLFGAFLVYARMENLEKVQSLVEPLSILMNKCACSQCVTPQESPFVAHPCGSTREQERKDWPVCGPDYVSIDECESYIKGTVGALRDLVARVKEETVRALANAMIYRLSSDATRCCKRGKDWKGCLQKLTNKYHYWKVLGVPTQVSYYREEEFSLYD